MPGSAAHARPSQDTAEWAHLHCSFCGKDGDHVRFLTGGLRGSIPVHSASVSSVPSALSVDRDRVRVIRVLRGYRSTAD